LHHDSQSEEDEFMRWWMWIGLAIVAFLPGVKLIGILASLALNPWRKRIREGFVAELKRFRPDIELEKVDPNYLLIRTPSVLTRFELEGLYTDVMNAKPHTDERILEIVSNTCAAYWRFLMVSHRVPTRRISYAN
jgi:hypothetical protein